MWNSSTDIDELRTLLEGLYPDVHIANRGLALLAARIRNLEDASLVIDPPSQLWRGQSINHSIHRHEGTTILWRDNYGANNYAK